jgi:glycosyltransferase involved in cell wall biosynthesis
MASEKQEKRARGTCQTLFLSRKYPPQRGGMESAAINLYSHLAPVRPTKLVKFGRRNSWLPFVVPLLGIRGLWHGLRPDTDAILLQDGVLAPLGVILGVLTRKPILVIIHGLEVTHTGGVFRRLMKWSLPRMSHVIAVSENTRDLVHALYPSLPVTVVNNGVSDDFVSTLSHADLDAELARITTLSRERIASATILVTIGRLIPRKGVRWFAEHVLPLLGEEYLYLVVGAGPEHDGITEAAAHADVTERVRMLGRISNEDLKVVLTRADVFVMPNVLIKDDVEGFGIAAVEASSTGTPVVAARADGIPDAVRSPGNGVLVTPEDAIGFVSAIAAIDNSPSARARVRAFTLRQFSWDACALEIDRVLDEAVAAR